MKLFKFNKKMAAVGLVIGLTLGAGGVAFAWFTSTGSGSGNASVGKSAANALTVSVTNDTSATLAPAALTDPNAATQTITYKVINTEESDVHLSTVAIKVTSGGTNTSCLASWFSINGAAPGTTVNVPQNTTLQPGSDTPGDTFTGHFTIQLVESTGTQNACQTAKPAVSVSAK